ncbi:hypothetical protein Q8A73_006191 [Channa argus]|nr:hypothetical protein Q8A73_006191 [Channa argus]
MGSEVSHDYEGISLNFYETALQHQCLLPDVGIDDSLLKYSGLNSTSELQTYSNELVNIVPGFITNLGSNLASFNSVPNAVGLGALVISLIIELIVKGDSQKTDDSYDMMRRVFGEEKASAVRDTMSEYLKRHHMFMNSEQRLRDELRTLERQLSGHLTVLKNSLLQDGQMSTRGFKIWVNGASFHVQMLVHEARLNSQRSSHQVDTINITISLYLRDLNNLLEKYKSYRTSTTSTYRGRKSCVAIGCAHSLPPCYMEVLETTGYSYWQIVHCQFKRVVPQCTVFLKRATRMTSLYVVPIKVINDSTGTDANLYVHYSSHQHEHNAE